VALTSRAPRNRPMHEVEAIGDGCSSGRPSQPAVIAADSVTPCGVDVVSMRVLREAARRFPCTNTSTSVVGSAVSPFHERGTSPMATSARPAAHLIRSSAPASSTRISAR